MAAVFKRDFKSYMVTMIGCVFVAFVICLISIYYSYYCLNSGYPYFGDVLCSIAYMVILALPILTMKSFADERKSKTDQMLYTSSLTVGKVVAGKYLAMAAVWALPMLVLCICPLILSQFGTVHYASDYSAILAVFLVGCAYIAIGMFISSLTESTIIAGVITFGVLLILQLMKGITSFISVKPSGSFVIIMIAVFAAAGIYYLLTKNPYMASGLAGAGFIALIAAYIKNKSMFYNLVPKFLNQIPLTDSLSNFSMKIFDVEAVVYYLSVLVVFVFLTTQTIQKRRYS